jgi:hypothetical protein
MIYVKIFPHMRWNDNPLYRKENDNYDRIFAMEWQAILI